MNIEIKPIEIAWNSDLPIYSSEAFLKVAGDEYGWLGGVDESGNLHCVLPYTIVRKSIFRMVRFRIQTIPLNEGFDVSQEKIFLNGVIQYFRAIGADIIIPATTNTIFRTYPDGAIAAPYGTYIIDLTLPEDALWSNLHSKHRNVIRNAIRKGVVIKNGIEYSETAYKLIRDTVKRSKLPFMSYKAFQNQIMGLGKYVKIMVAEYQGSVQGCAILPFSNYGAYYVYGGTIPNPLTGAMNLLQWEAIRLFRELKVKRYDFVGVRINPAKGSKQEGLQMFKQRFGGQLIQGFMWKYQLHPLRSAAYSLAVRILRGGDIVDCECHKLKSA